MRAVAYTPFLSITAAAGLSARSANGACKRLSAPPPSRSPTLALHLFKSASMDSAAKRSEMVQDMYNRYKRSFSKVPDLSPEELMKLLEEKNQGLKKVVVVDVRGEDEQQVSMIPWGTLKKVDFEEKKSGLRDHIVVTYCTIGYRSGKYAEALQKENFDVYNLAGSIIAWTHAGYPLVAKYSPEGGSCGEEDVDGITRKVHVFGEKWRLANDGYDMVLTEPKGVLGHLKAKAINWFG